jgi:hypothetical protein
VDAGVYGGSVMLTMEIDPEDRVKKKDSRETHTNGRVPIEKKYSQIIIKELVANFVLVHSFSKLRNHRQ